MSMLAFISAFNQEWSRRYVQIAETWYWMLGKFVVV